jgi:hypothetical protein
MYHHLQKVADSNSSNTSVAARKTLVARVRYIIVTNLVTSLEVEELIVRLHEEGKTSREISKLVHKNFTYIGAVLRKRFPEEYTDSCTTNRETQALKLFSEKRTPTQVAIELGSSTDETEKFYTNFWRLERLYDLYNIYKEYPRNLRAFLHFLNQLRDGKVTTRRGFNKVLKIIDNNNAMEELADFNINTSPEIWNNDSSTDVLV